MRTTLSEITNIHAVGFIDAGEGGGRHSGSEPTSSSGGDYFFHIGRDVTGLILELGEDNELLPFEDADIFEVKVFGQPSDTIAATWSEWPNIIDLRGEVI